MARGRRALRPTQPGRARPRAAAHGRVGAPDARRAQPGTAELPGRQAVERRRSARRAGRPTRRCRRTSGASLAQRANRCRRRSPMPRRPGPRARRQADGSTTRPPVAGASRGGRRRSARPRQGQHRAQSSRTAKLQPVSPTVVQAKPGATHAADHAAAAPPPPHQQPGMPKIAATSEFVDRKTLLPQRGPQSAGAEPRAAAARVRPSAEPGASRAASQRDAAALSCIARPMSLPRRSPTPTLRRRLACLRLRRRAAVRRGDDRRPSSSAS